MDRIVARTPSLDAEIAQRLDAILVARDAPLAPAERKLVVRVTIACVRTGMRLIGRATRATRQSVIAEVKAVLTSYLRSRTEASCP
jgi:hypothetical protein